MKPRHRENPASGLAETVLIACSRNKAFMRIAAYGRFGHSVTPFSIRRVNLRASTHRDGAPGSLLRHPGFRMVTASERKAVAWAIAILWSAHPGRATRRVYPFQSNSAGLRELSGPVIGHYRRVFSGCHPPHHAPHTYCAFKGRRHHPAIEDPRDAALSWSTFTIGDRVPCASLRFQIFKDPITSLCFQRPGL